MKKILLAGLVVIFAGGQLYGMNDGGKSVVLATRECREWAMHDQVKHVLVVVETPDEVGFVDKKEPKTGKTYSDLIGEICDEVGVILRSKAFPEDSKDFLAAIPSRERYDSPWQNAHNTRGNWVWKCVEYCRFRIHTLIVGHYTKMRISIHRNDGEPELTYTFDSMSKEAQKKTDERRKSDADKQRQEIGNDWRTYVKTKETTEYKDFLAKAEDIKRAQEQVNQRRASQRAGEEKELKEITEGIENLTMSDQDLQALTVHDGKSAFGHPKMQTLLTEIANMRTWLQENLWARRNSRYKEERERVQALIAGINAIDEKGEMKVESMISQEGFKDSAKLFYFLNKMRLVIKRSIQLAGEEDNPLKEKADFIIEGFVYFANKLFQEDQEITSIVQNNVQLIQVLAFLKFTSLQKKSLIRRVFNCCCKTDPKYARDLEKALLEMNALLNSEISKGCCKSRCCAEPIDHLLSLIYGGCVAGWWYYLQTMNEAQASFGFW